MINPYQKYKKWGHAIDAALDVAFSLPVIYPGAGNLDGIWLFSVL